MTLPGVLFTGHSQQCTYYRVHTCTDTTGKNHTKALVPLPLDSCVCRLIDSCMRLYHVW